ncbi:unnamed protein product [Haemonchus placei]|uniref:Astacin domain-containing protein n=1 Tax=Haemonchus placei TaxID=6290 RepID=A0A0N4W1F5_HAEPC|nr:unnamed protein product [Haemonchus placei]
MYEFMGGSAYGQRDNFQNLIRRGIRMWEEATCLRFRENMASRDAIRYVLEKGDSCFTEYIGRNGGHQDIIIGSECAELNLIADNIMGYLCESTRAPNTIRMRATPNGRILTVSALTLDDTKKYSWMNSS